jgi:hypothetical protein
MKETGRILPSSLHTIYYQARVQEMIEGLMAHQ